MIALALVVYCYLVLQMALVWLLYLRYKNTSIVDMFWSLGLLVAGVVYLSNGVLLTRSLIVGLLLGCWALRLSGYIWLTRVKRHSQDRRYEEISAQWKLSKAMGYFFNYQFQGLLIWLISTVFMVIADQLTQFPSIYDVIASVLVLSGIIGESISDLQLLKFRSLYPGKVCNVGLWWYSRHPNYFFDWIVWVGFSTFSIGEINGCIGLIAPLLLYIIFNYVTGPITERVSIQTKGQAYIDYQRITPMFFPRFTNVTNLPSSQQ